MKRIICLYSNLSSALERAGNILIGLKSSREWVREFLCNGMTLAVFQRAGNKDLVMTELNTCVTVGKITGKSILTNEIGIKSMPTEFDLILQIALTTSKLVTPRNENGESEAGERTTDGLYEVLITLGNSE